MFLPETSEVPEECLTERLALRAPSPGSGFSIFESVQASLNELRLWMPWVQGPMSEESAEEEVRRAFERFRSREDLRFNIYRREDGRFVGATGLHRIDWQIPKFEIGYWVDSRLTGMGYATEAARGMTELAFGRLNAKRVEIRCDTRNRISAKIPPKLGYDLEGILRQDRRSCLEPFELRDTMVFAKTG